MNKKKYNIILSIADASEKITTFNFKKKELHLLSELQDVLNTKAVSNGMFLNGHRNQKNLQGMGNIYMLDFDIEPLDNEQPYYLMVEESLKNQNLAFVSVPSQSADLKPFKRHIVIILSDCINHNKEKFLTFEKKLLTDLDININLIDKHVVKNQAVQIAPAIINQSFTDYSSKSYFFEGNPYKVDNKFIEQIGTDKAKKFITNDIHIKFFNNSVVTVEEAKQIVKRGDNKQCYCPTHNDTNPSATFFHNNNGLANIYCHICGNIPLQKNHYNYEPTIKHSEYKYSIKIFNPNTKIENLFGKPTLRTKEYSQWFFNVMEIDDIDRIHLAKKQLVQDRYRVDFTFNNQYDEENIIGANTSILLRYIANTKPPKLCFNSKTDKPLYPNKIIYLHLKKYIFESFINPETIILLFYYNFPLEKDFEKICNRGLGYYEYVLKTIEWDKNKFQMNKKFPTRLNSRQKEKVYKYREEERMKRVLKKMTTMEKDIFNLMQNPDYQRNGSYNCTKIGSTLELNRATVKRYVEKIIKK